MHELATAVYQIRGHIKGRTLLPFPQVTLRVKKFSQNINAKGSGEIVHEEKRVRESDGKEVRTMKIIPNTLTLLYQKVNTLLKNNIEGIILKWSYQVSMASPFSNDMNNINK